LFTPGKTAENFADEQDFNCRGKESDEDEADLGDYVRHPSEVLYLCHCTYNKDECATNGLPVAVAALCQIPAFKCLSFFHTVQLEYQHT